MSDPPGFNEVCFCYYQLSLCLLRPYWLNSTLTIIPIFRDGENQCSFIRTFAQWNNEEKNKFPFPTSGIAAGSRAIRPNDMVDTALIWLSGAHVIVAPCKQLIYDPHMMIALTQAATILAANCTWQSTEYSRPVPQGTCQHSPLCYKLISADISGSISGFKMPEWWQIKQRSRGRNKEMGNVMLKDNRQYLRGLERE